MPNEPSQPRTTLTASDHAEILLAAIESGAVNPKAIAEKVISIADEGFDPAKGCLAAYVKGIVANLIKSQSRRGRQEDARTEPLPEDDEIVDESAFEAFEREIDLAELRRKILKLWPDLSFMDGYVLCIRFWLGFSFEEIAALPEFKKYGVTAGALKCRVCRVYKKLRPVLVPFSPRPASGCCKVKSKGQLNKHDSAPPPPKSGPKT